MEQITLGSLACGLVRQVTFRHAWIIGAVYTRVRAWPWLCYDSDGRHARGGAARFHLQGAQEASVKVGINVPRFPKCAIPFLFTQVEGEYALFGEDSTSIVNAFAVLAYDAVECRWT